MLAGDEIAQPFGFPGMPGQGEDLVARLEVEAGEFQAQAAARSGDGNALQNFTLGASLAASSASKYSRSLKPNIPAMKLLGKVLM